MFRSQKNTVEGGEKRGMTIKRAENATKLSLDSTGRAEKQASKFGKVGNTERGLHRKKNMKK